MIALLRTALHHSEAIDPTLIEWIRHEIDDITGLEPTSIVAILGAVLLAFPIWLAISAARRQRRHEESGSTHEVR